MEFENDVKTYSIQTGMVKIDENNVFENDVKMYGIQTTHQSCRTSLSFENDVKMYGIQTCPYKPYLVRRLRMM